MARKTKYLLVTVLPLLLVACATPIQWAQSNNDDRDRLLNGEALPVSVRAGISQPSDDILGLSAEMIRFLNQATANSETESDKIKALLRALIPSDEMNFVLDPAATYTAAQTFEQRRANCLSFAGMMVAMLRHLGIRAAFNEVDVPEIWDMQSPKTMVLYKHVNVMIHTRTGRRQIVDVDLAEYDESYRQRIISDLQATAQYYNNRAMAYMIDNNLSDAFSYLAKAIMLDPQGSFLWANLGSLYRRVGNLEAAELSYQAALSEDRGNLVAISNLARLYESEGRTEMARELIRKANYFRSRNPYYRYQQGMSAFLNQDFEGAMSHTKAAIRIYPKEHRFHFLLGAIYQKVGNQKKAEASMQKAIEMSTDTNQSAKYQSKVSRLLSSR